MPSHPSAAAFAALDPPAAEFRPPAGTQPRDLAELAAALARIEALLAGDAEGPEGSAAIERIADIAFVLHERDIEPSLCDALDAAIREIGAADALKRASVRRACEAAALLRDLSHALHAMVVTTEAEQPPQVAATAAEADMASSRVQVVQESRDAEAAAADELAAPAELFAAGMPENDGFVLSVAALAKALPQGDGTASADLRDKMAEPVAPSATLTHCEDAVDAEAIEAAETIESFRPEDVIVSHCAAEDNLPEQMPGGPLVAAVDAALGAEASEQTVLPEALLNEPAAAPGGGDLGASASRIAALGGAESPFATESVAPARPDAASAAALPEAPAEEPASATQSEPVAVMPPAITAAPAPGHGVTDQSLDLQTAAHAVVHHDQGPSVTELAEGGPIDAVESIVACDDTPARDEAPARDEQNAERDEVAGEPMASQPTIDPNEDPGDLFEPVADARLPLMAPASAAIAAPSDGEAAPASIPLAVLPLAPAASPEVAAQPPQPATASALRLPPVAPVPAPPPPSPSDPLAPIRALSAEELIALFS